MSARAAIRLVWLAPVLALALGALATLLLAAIPAERLPREDRLDALDVLFSLAFVAYAAVGALIAAKHPRNAVGWLFCAFGLLFPVVGVLWSYATYGLYGTVGGLPGQAAAAWVYAWSVEFMFLVLTLLILLFPDGRFLTPRWRRVGLAAVATAIAVGLAIAFDPGPLYTFDKISNPLGIDAAGGVLETIIGIGPVTSTLLLIAAGASLVLRYRRAEAIERQQIKWLAAGAALAVILIAIFGTLELTVETDRGVAEVVTSVLALLSLGVIPVAAGIAMLRHRLYDIDVVIRRTVVYGALTATLVGAYLSSVLLLQLALSPESDIAIAGSTLAVAALFQPLRNRIQGVVDRRFFRSRYDAERTLEGFGTRLRDEVDLDALGQELCGVVAQTMQPAHVSVWLRESEVQR
jgi:hypothetical protein